MKTDTGSPLYPGHTSVSIANQLKICYTEYLKQLTIRLHTNRPAVRNQKTSAFLSLERNLMAMQNKSALSRHVPAHADLQSLSGTISSSVRLTCLFGSFAFLQFIILGLANHAGEGYLATGQRELVYYALQVFVILGFLLHAAYARLYKADQKTAAVRKGIAIAVCSLFFACIAVMLFAGYDSLFYVIVSMAAALCLGGIGGAAHYRMSRETVTGAPVARCMGIGSAAAVMLQYLLQIRQGISPLLPIFMLAAFLLLIFLLPDNFPKSVAEKPEKPIRTLPKQIVLAILITAVFILFAGFYNEYIHHLQIQSDYGAYNVYSWPRLMLVPGYLLFAVIGDRKNGKFVPVASLCIMLIALLNVVLIGNPDSHWLNMCLFYCAIAAFTSYYLLTFWRLAPGTRHPALWAPFGRIIDSGMVLLTGAIHLSTLPAPVVLGTDIAGIAVIIILMTVSGNFNLAAPSASGTSTTRNKAPDISEIPAPEPPRLLSPEEALDRMREQYGLTPRETDVLRELVLTEDKQAVIGERLSIRVKTLQDHITRLYHKTGATTRAGLTNLYHESQNQA